MPPRLQGTAPGAPPSPWYRRIAPRYLALLIAGIFIVGAAGAYGVVTLLDEGEPAPPPVASEPTGGASDRGGGEPVDPSAVTVAVLNATSVPGLAAQIGDTIEAAGFERGNVANATDQQAAESAVLYADGEKAAAREVAKELGISQTQPIDPESQSLAGDATVVVVVGADQS